MNQQISIEGLKRVEMRVGTIFDASPNAKANKPAYVLSIDFGAKPGLDISSARIAENYKLQG